MQAEAGQMAGSFPQEAISRKTLRSETVLVLALSLGASGVSALISFVGSLTKPESLNSQAATLNSSAAPGRPWLDLAWQLFGISTALVPVALVAHLLLREGSGVRDIGFDGRRPWPDLGRGTLVAAGIGSAGLAFYLVAQAVGFNLTVVPESLPDVWWKFPVLILSAVQNSVLEEVIVVGYLLQPAGTVGVDPDGGAGGEFGAARLVPPVPGDRRLHRKHGDGRGLRTSVPAVGAGRSPGGGPCPARHRSVCRVRAAGGEGGLAAHGVGPVSLVSLVGGVGARVLVRGVRGARVPYALGAAAGSGMWPFQGELNSSPSMTVTARPVSRVRSPRSAVRTNPVRAEAWRPVSSARPSLADQNGASTV